MHIVRFAVTLLFLVFSAPLFAHTTLYHNFTGYTFVEGHGEHAALNRFTTMLVREGKIVATGDSGLFELAPDAERVDLAGRIVLPGLIDAHGHVTGLGQNLSELDLRGLTSRTSAVAQVANYAEANIELPWIIGRGWNQVIWPEQSFPTRQDLDQVLSDRPVWLTRIDGHAGWANSRALEIAGITRDTPSPAGGEIVKDEQGEPTGILIDTAMALVRKHIPAASDEQVMAYQEAAFQQLLSEGITQAHDAGVSKQALLSYQAHAEAGNMIRIHAMLSASDPALESLLAEGPHRTDNHLLQVRSVKIYGDGALGSRGAALLKPYSDDAENSGLLVTPEVEVARLFNLAIEHDFQVNYHAIGDYTNRLALDTFEGIFQAQGTDKTDLRHRIEHAQIIHPNDIPRFKELGITPSMQPTHATSDMNMAEDRLGSTRLAGAYAWRTFLDQGSLVAAGSDFPVELSNPFYGIHAAVTRQDRNNQPVDGWHPEQAMTVAEALRSFTIDAAWAGHYEDVTGSLEPGKFADFIVVDKDPFKIKPSNLWRVKVLSTYIAGQRRYQLQP
ncbi:amidohydrolase [Aliidiomarina taiwanensis]|uniref:Amidohydrolase n=1 Tax=Aliidiomarina taiwanensis TaxID=946228 RepID=A0A432WZD7_9GAMM|nr:amidohydrolase [Aliidiomarina taiwanensis]RUO39051.1 amidohydrolase [Aliidiomarina taiwanensis]